MKSIIAAAAVVLGATACSANSATDVTHVVATQNVARDSIQASGPLLLVVTDSLARPGVMFALPSITPQQGSIVVSNTRYGSLCRFAISGYADVRGDAIGLHVAFTERLTSCTAELRAVRYDATISGLSRGKAYDVAVIHEQNGVADTVRKETVVVR